MGKIATTDQCFHEKKSLTAHVTDLKKLILQIIFVYLGTFICAYVLRTEIYQWLISPLVASFSTAGVNNSKMIYTGIAEAFISYLSLSNTVAFVVCIPFITFQIYRFIKSGLYIRERKIAASLMIMGNILFISAIVFVYYVVIPKAWGFFLEFEIRNNAQYNLVFEARISEYISMVTTMIKAFGIAFQMPIIMLLLILMQLITVSQLKSYRRIAIVVIFTIAAFITPPDILSQILLALPMMAMYEMTILISTYIQSRDVKMEKII